MYTSSSLQMDVNAAVQQALADKLLEAAKIAEDEIDREIERLERLDEDDLEGNSCTSKTLVYLFRIRIFHASSIFSLVRLAVIELIE